MKQSNPNFKRLIALADRLTQPGGEDFEQFARTCPKAHKELIRSIEKGVNLLLTAGLIETETEDEA